MKGHGVLDDKGFEDILVRLQKDIHHQFSQVKLLSRAMTHSSYANERQAGEEHNERLEFLGDAVLELCISAELFRRFPDAREGQLTAMRSRMVKQETLARLARDLGLSKAIVLGRGEERQGGRDRDSLLSDVFEAMLGAVYLDGGFEAARRVVEWIFVDAWPEPGEKKKAKDNKSQLQEVTQQRFRERPVYTLVGSQGPEHDKTFEIRLLLPNGESFLATGTSVKRAEQTVARMALLHLGEEKGG